LPYQGSWEEKSERNLFKRNSLQVTNVWKKEINGGIGQELLSE